MQFVNRPEYGIALQMYCDHNKTLRKNDPLYMLAFSVYKNFWPDDYHTILDNQNGAFKSNVFPTRNLEALERKGFPHMNLLKILSPYLTLESLSCAGFNQRVLIDSIHQSWNQRIGAPSEIVKDIDSFAKENVICLKAVWGFCAASTDDLILAAAVRCAIRCEANREDKLWFFRNRTPLECCKILANDALNALDEAKKDAFCETADKFSCFGLFAECESVSDFYRLPWTERLMEEFSRRVKQLPDLYQEHEVTPLCGKPIKDWFSEDNP